MKNAAGRRAEDELLLNPAAARRKFFQNHYLSSGYRPQLFDTHDIGFALRQGPSYDQLREFNTALYVTHTLSLHGQRGVYGAGSISKGMLANILAVKQGPFTVRLDDGTTFEASHVSDMDETVGSQLFVDKVIDHNKRIQLQKQGLFRASFPGKHVLLPIMLQGALGVVGQPEFDRGAKRRDPAWMQLWTPDIRENCDIFPVFGDWFFSGATSGYEYPEAECIAAGLRDRRPKADMWFRDINNCDVPQSEIIRRRAEYLIWAAEQRNFRVKYEATAFMRSCAIAEMADRGQLPRANPAFLKGISDNIGDIRYMRKEMEPLILERIRAYMFPFNTADLGPIFPDFVKKAEEAKAGHHAGARIVHIPVSAPLETVKQKLADGNIRIRHYEEAELEAGDFEFLELRDQLDPDKYLDHTEAVAVTRPMRPVDMKGQSHIEHDGRSLFSRPLLGGLNERERQQVGVAIGGMETVMPHDGRSVYVVADDGIAGPGKTIRKHMRNATHRLPLMQRFAAKQQPVRFSHEFDDLIAGFGALPKFSMALGEKRPGELAAQAIRHAVLAQCITDFCFVTGQWEKSEQGVQDMMLATRMQFGLEAASSIDPQYVRVFDERGRNLTIDGRMRMIFEVLEPELLKTPDAPHLREQATAVVQLRALHRLSRDPTLRRSVFRDLSESQPNIELPADLNWERIPAQIFAYDHRAADHGWNHKILPALEEQASQIIRLRHLDRIEDFRTIRDRQIAAQAITASENPPRTSVYRRLPLLAKDI